MNQNVSKGQDPFISAFLDQVLEVTGIDPSSVVPDYKLSQDLGLTRVQMQMVLSRSAKALGLNIPFESCRVEDATARELVDRLKNWSANTLSFKLA